MKTTLLFREVNDKVHILNYSTGEVQSFDLVDGKYLFSNIGKLPKLKKELEPKLYNFLTKTKSQINSRSIRGPLLQLGNKFSFPTIVNFEINRRCVLRCRHCYISTKDLSNTKREIIENYSQVQIQNLLISLKQLGVFLIVLTGGESFLNKNMHSILLLASKLGFIIEIFTNLQYLPEWFLNFDPFDLKIGRIQTSVYSVVPTTHDNITQGNGSLNKLLENIKILKQKNYYLEIATPLMSLNYKDRNKTKQYFIKQGIKQSFSWPIINEYYSKKTGKSLLNINKNQFVKFCKENPDYLTKLKFKRNSYICATGRALISISANGDVFPCSQYPQKVGNIKHSDIAKIYNSNQMQKIRELNTNDIKDKKYSYNFCVGTNYSETGDPLKIPNFILDNYRYYTESLKKGGDKK